MDNRRPALSASRRGVEDRARSRLRKGPARSPEVVIVAEEVVRRWSRQALARPKAVQFSLTQEEFDQVNSAAVQAGLARGASAAEVT
jgi:hypothetical protein